ncbi:F-box protein [Artemisia annua]|uniref:F-box protein n=1 Tax=Artemisia annua TaxID=35608 RepID=A0A2U1P8F5_ARTAN|nr:F-box protein [Artemisia annua]
MVPGEWFRKLKHVDFSDTYCLTGSFLKNLGTNGGGNNLEVMILRDTTDLKQMGTIALVLFSLP